MHIGLNRVDPAHYAGWDGPLRACEADAKDMYGVARACGCSSHLLLGSEATACEVMTFILRAAGKLKRDDFFFLSFSGHGGQVPDSNNDEVGGQDETWAHYDRQLVVDELYTLWGRFVPGVRILVVADTGASAAALRASAGPQFYSPQARYRVLPEEVARTTYAQNTGLYDGIQNVHSKGDAAPVTATVLVLSGCQDNQLAVEGPENGLFTEQLKKVWDDGRFTGGYRVFRRQIAALLPPTQSPGCTRIGASHPSFERQKPFTI